MKKGLIILASLLIFLAGAYFLFNKKVGDVIPIVLPPKDLEIPAKIGEKSSLPFSLPTGFSIGIFAKKLNGARDLEFASDGTLFVSLTSPGKIVALA
ncbi:hypothetical protein HY029_04890, partial [Candidatus Gottesmanbacteria bacterium]|nr:hypothetical protein [Candidatus Gottesmanbacteria bacterium]